MVRTSVSSSLYSIHPFRQNHPGGKYRERQGIESIPSPEQQLLYPFFYESSYPIHGYWVRKATIALRGYDGLSVIAFRM